VVTTKDVTCFDTVPTIYLQENPTERAPIERMVLERMAKEERRILAAGGELVGDVTVTWATMPVIGREYETVEVCTAHRACHLEEPECSTPE